MIQTNQKVNYGGMSLGHDGELTQARAIDSLGLGNISFIKIDVQGSEKMVIYGARETIKRCLPVVNYEDAAHWGFGEAPHSLNRIACAACVDCTCRPSTAGPSAARETPLRC